MRSDDSAGSGGPQEVVGPYSGPRFALKPKTARDFVADLALDGPDRGRLLAGFDAEWARRKLD